MGEGCSSTARHNHDGAMIPAPCMHIDRPKALHHHLLPPALPLASHVPPPIPHTIVPQVIVKTEGESTVNFVGKKQFIVRTLVFSKTDSILPQILVDTGAQPNLVRKGLSPPHLFRRSTHPLHLSAANSGTVDGGRFVILLTLCFQNNTTGKKMSFRGLFYEADIPMDIILSNGWMARNKIIPIPELTQLGVRHGNEIHLLSSLAQESANQSPTSLEKPMVILGTSPNCDDTSENEEVLATTFDHNLGCFYISGEIGENDDILEDSDLAFLSKTLSHTPHQAQIFGLVQTE